jgi:hypothetical protein
MYSKEFHEAIERTKRFNITAPPILPVSGDRFFTKESMQELMKSISKTIGQPSPEDLETDCFSINHRIKQIIDDLFKTTSVFTLGWVDEPSKCLFKSTEEELRELLVKGISTTTIDLHAWITMPSMEIFDCTLCTKIAIANDDKKLLYAITARHVDDMSGGFVFHPMLVGVDYLNILGIYVYESK